MDLIFGRSWEEIQQMQQGTYRGRDILPVDPKEEKKKIEEDMKKFGLGVNGAVVKKLGITVPADYILTKRNGEPFWEKKIS